MSTTRVVQVGESDHPMGPCDSPLTLMKMVMFTPTEKNPPWPPFLKGGNAILPLYEKRGRVMLPFYEREETPCLPL